MLMRTRIHVVLTALLLANLLSASTLTWDRTAAHLEMTPEQEEIRASYHVTNHGEKTIRIARIQTSCGCTSSIIDGKILKPGQSTEIIGIFNKGKRRGLNRNRLEVFIDGQTEPVATLHMNVQIPKLVAAMPQIIYWSPTGTKTERRLKLTLDERYVDQIIRIDYDRSKLTLIEEDDPRGEVTRILRVTPKSYDAPYRGTIRVLASGPDGRQAEARIHALVQP